MSQHIHIATKHAALRARATIVYHIREFFAAAGVLEITAPTLIRYPGQEPNLEPMSVVLRDDRGATYEAYLHTSPEYTLKKCIAAGLGDVYSLGSAFRNLESFGGNHNPEFTMLEWYRVGADMIRIMDDLDALFARVSEVIPNTVFATPIKRLHMRDVWHTYVGIDLDAYLTRDALYTLCSERGYTCAPEDPYEVLFYTIFLNDIEPHLGFDAPMIVHHYPAPMAALSRISPHDSRYAERFEIYVGGIELGNAFTELTDSTEQRERLLEEREERKKRGMSVFALDEDFLEAVGALPPCAGIAFGVDRFVQLLLGCQTIEDVVVLPASKLFKEQ